MARINVAASVAQGSLFEPCGSSRSFVFPGTDATGTP